MEFRRSGGRDERRRRVLREENLADEAGEEKTSARGEEKASRSTPDYADAASASRQPRISDLIPRSPWLIAGLALLGLAVAGGIVAAAWYSPDWSWLDGPTANIFAAEARGNLASWFGCLIMLSCGIGALQIYLLRRHKIDDYRGRYRLWGWVALAFLIASADMVVGLRDMCGLALGMVIPDSWGIGQMWLVLAPISLVSIATMIRLAIEMRRSRGTLAALLLATICYAGSAATTVEPSLFASAGVTDSRATSTLSLGLMLTGHWSVLLTTMLFARYVFLAANGMLKIRIPKPKPARKKQTAGANDSDETTDEKPAPKRSTTKRSRKSEPATTASAQAEKKPSTTKKSEPRKPPAKIEDSPPDESPATLSLEELANRDNLTDADTSHLTKAERRRLRKLQRRSKRAA